MKNDAGEDFDIAFVPADKLWLQYFKDVGLAESLEGVDIYSHKSVLVLRSAQMFDGLAQINGISELEYNAANELYFPMYEAPEHFGVGWVARLYKGQTESFLEEFASNYKIGPKIDLRKHLRE